MVYYFHSLRPMSKMLLNFEMLLSFLKFWENLTECWWDLANVCEFGWNFGGVEDCILTILNSSLSTIKVPSSENEESWKLKKHIDNFVHKHKQTKIFNKTYSLSEKTNIVSWQKHLEWGLMHGLWPVLFKTDNEKQNYALQCLYLFIYA